MIRPSSLRRVMLCYLEGDGRRMDGGATGDGPWAWAGGGGEGACLGTCPANPIPLAQGTGARRQAGGFWLLINVGAWSALPSVSR